MFVHPQPSCEERDRQYLDDLTSPADYYAATARVDRESFAQRLVIIERHVPVGRLLDVGCSVGTFMGVAAERGWKVVGLEPNPIGWQRARDAGLNVVQGFLCAEVLDTLEGDFDLVNMGDVIEHFADPCEAVRVVASRLRPGGVLSVSTPDFQSLVARCFQVKPQEHLFYFTADTLSRVLERSELRIEMLAHTTRRRDLRNILRGTTALGRGLQVLVRCMAACGVVDAISWVTAKIVRDELWVLARRP